MQTGLNKTIKTMKDTWARLFPQVPAPADSQWTLWLLLHDDPNIVRCGMAILARKHQALGGSMDSDYMTRFMSSVMARMTREKSGESGRYVSGVVRRDVEQQVMSTNSIERGTFG